MSLATFQAAVHAAAAKYAPQYGLSPAELEHALLVDANLEGGLGASAAVGDNGNSVGRFQFNMNGGHGATLLNQGYTRDQIADDAFQADNWAPILAAHLKDQHDVGRTGAQAVRDAIFNSERPAVMYDTGRVNASITAANGLTGLSVASLSGGSAPATSSTGGAKVASTDYYNQLAPWYGDWARLNTKVSSYYGGDGNPLVPITVGADGGLYAEVPTGATNPVTGKFDTTLKQILSAAEYQQFVPLDQKMAALRKQAGADDTVAQAIDKAKFSYDSSNASVDAQNAANQYANQLKARTEAVSLANTRLTEQGNTQDAAIKEFNSPFGGGAVRTPSSNLAAPDAIYKSAVDDISKGLPDVPKLPYYTGSQQGAGSTNPLDTATTQLDQEGAARTQAIGHFDPRRVATLAAEEIAAQNPAPSPSTARAGNGIFGAIRRGITGSVLASQAPPLPPPAPGYRGNDPTGIGVADATKIHIPRYSPFGG